MHRNHNLHPASLWRKALNLVSVVLSRIGDHAFREPDAFAFVVGWQIDRSKWNRRTYRDPRFDDLKTSRPQSTGSPGGRR